MDPNEALLTQRALLAVGIDNLTAEQLRELAEAAQALDGWLTAGGFLPEAWAR